MTSSDNPPIWLLYALLSSGPRTFEKLLRGPWLGDSFHLSPIQGYRRENHGDRCPDNGFKGGWIVCLFVCFFQGQYLPSLNTNCLSINKDMEKWLPQLYYTKMKNCCKQCYMLTSAPVHDCGKKLSMPRNTAARKIDNDVISLLWRLLCQHNNYVKRPVITQFKKYDN